MPTGYTHKIKDDITFNEFIMDCARAFGACIDLRDSSAPIPEEFKADTKYHSAGIKKAYEELSVLIDASPEDIHKMAEAEILAKYERDKEYRNDKIKLRAKYEAMLEQVNNWVPPSGDHYGLKRFMQEQLEGSIKFDCTPHNEPLVIPKVNSGAWKRDAIKKANEEIAYHNEKITEEIDRVLKRNIWIKQLRESIK